LVDRFCRRCGESLQVPAPGAQAAIARLADKEPPPGEEMPKRRGVVSTPPTPREEPPVSEEKPRK